jgi:hypothetical protein
MSALDIINLALSFVTAVSASYLAFAALAHSARPRASVTLSPIIAHVAERLTLVFVFKNRGYWYAKPIIVNMTIYINFDSAFDLVEMRSGSSQQNINTEAKSGKGHMKYFKSKGMHLSFGEDGEEIHIVAQAPKKPGRYKLKVSAFSENGVSLSEVISLYVRPSLLEIDKTQELSLPTSPPHDPPA